MAKSSKKAKKSIPKGARRLAAKGASKAAGNAGGRRPTKPLPEPKAGQAKAGAKLVASKPAPPPRRKAPLPKHLQDLRDTLQRLLRQLEDNINKEVKGAGERDLAHILDTSDMAADSAEGDLSFRIAESAGANAAEIRRAIDKIDAGTYGRCEGCGAKINAARLQFLPFATHCIKCQTLTEIRRKEDGEVELDDLAEAEETHEDA